MAIDKDGTLRCDGCNKKLAVKLIGYLEIVCIYCDYFNVFDTSRLPKRYYSHKVLVMEEKKRQTNTD